MLDSPESSVDLVFFENYVNSEWEEALKVIGIISAFYRQDNTVSHFERRCESHNPYAENLEFWWRK